MGWFDEQIRQRKLADDAAFEDSFADIAGAVLGKKFSAAQQNDGERAKDAMEEILKYYHIKSPELPDTIKDLNDQLEYLMRPHGIMRRSVDLTEGWYKDALGALLGTKADDGCIVALIPCGLSGYRFFDHVSGKWIKLSKATEKLIDPEAVCFYKPLPPKKIGVKDLAKYIVGTLSSSDYILVALATLAVSLVDMLNPKLNYLLFSEVVTHDSSRLLLATAIFMASVAVSSIIFAGIKTLLMSRINTKMDVSVQAATMMRVLSLPASFFKKYSSGELSSRTQYINSLSNMLASAVLSTGLTSVFSLIYITQVFTYAPALVVPALLIILATVLFSIITTIAQMKINERQMELAAKESGMCYALLSGIQKIKLSGAEKRAFARWGRLYAEEAKLSYDPPKLLKLNDVIGGAISLIGMVVMYYAAVKSGMGVADYYAFNVAYGMVSGAFMSLVGTAITVARIKPTFEMARPILEAVPEVSENKQVISRLSGAIELNNVSFRYNDNMPLILDDISLKIRAGQYVAIVGATGCGKSTLMRIMLGFETPQKGAVYYDGKDLTTIDLRSLRRKIGVVMQNGKLFQGDIYSNIVISAPQLTIDEAWKAARTAGIENDIKAMPMGMHTIISEGSGGISGGQKQRLMIARAIAPKPRVLMFDEATSALDNATQKHISEAINKLKCTRIVIAHRLSTIKQCDRIIVLENGKIIEDGTYDVLIEKNGYFAGLVARQRLDNTEFVGKKSLL